MKKLVTILCLSFVALYAKESREYLEGRIDPSNHRYSTFIQALDLCQERGVRVIVETGTSRDGEMNYQWDGGSTNIFVDWARDHNATLYSVDIDERSIMGAAEGLMYNLDNVHLVHDDSIHFLSNFRKPVDFLYLDSYDFDFNNPHPSQYHHLKELKAIYPQLHDKTIIMIDDCALPHGGKGKYAIEYLVEKGWKIYAKAYQVILLKTE